MDELPPIDLSQLRRDRLARQERAPLPGYRFIYGPAPAGPDDPPNIFTLSHEADWPSQAAAALRVGDLPLAFELLVGPDQWADLMRHDPQPAVGDWVEFEAALAAQQGLRSLGESTRSENGSAPTPAPSGPTSDGSTASTWPTLSPEAPPTTKGRGRSKT